MAKAKIKTETRERMVLELTRKEAKYLQTLLGYCVIGSGPAREANGSIFYALEGAEAGVLNGYPDPGRSAQIDVTNWKL